MRRRIISSLFGVAIILLMTEIWSSHGHRGCNHGAFSDQLYYMCKSYKTSTIKRETNVDWVPYENDSNDDNSELPTWVEQQQEQSSSLYSPSNYGQQGAQQYPLEFPGNTYYALPLQPLQQPQLNSFYPWVGEWQARQPSDVKSTPYFPKKQQRKNKNLNSRFDLDLKDPAPIPNEPEDFASFNDWYLNPIYAGSDFQSPIERWRRKIYSNDFKQEVNKFLDKCCSSRGCHYPDDYWELDKRTNICGMR